MQVVDVVVLSWWCFGYDDVIFSYHDLFLFMALVLLCWIFLKKKYHWLILLYFSFLKYFSKKNVKEYRFA
jgi:hypothetical protein